MRRGPIFGARSNKVYISTYIIPSRIFDPNLDTIHKIHLDSIINLNLFHYLDPQFVQPEPNICADDDASSQSRPVLSASVWSTPLMQKGSSSSDPFNDSAVGYFHRHSNCKIGTKPLRPLGLGARSRGLTVSADFYEYRYVVGPNSRYRY